jgi:hypothetical protein
VTCIDINSKNPDLIAAGYGEYDILEQINQSKQARIEKAKENESKEKGKLNVFETLIKFIDGRLKRDAGGG